MAQVLAAQQAREASAHQEKVAQEAFEANISVSAAEVQMAVRGHEPLNKDAVKQAVLDTIKRVTAGKSALARGNASAPIENASMAPLIVSRSEASQHPAPSPSPTPASAGLALRRNEVASSPTQLSSSALARAESAETQAQARVIVAEKAMQQVLSREIQGEQAQAVAAAKQKDEGKIDTVRRVLSEATQRARAEADAALEAAQKAFREAQASGGNLAAPNLSQARAQTQAALQAANAAYNEASHTSPASPYSIPVVKEKVAASPAPAVTPARCLRIADVDFDRWYLSESPPRQGTEVDCSAACSNDNSEHKAWCVGYEFTANTAGAGTRPSSSTCKLFDNCVQATRDAVFTSFNAVSRPSDAAASAGKCEPGNWKCEEAAREEARREAAAPEVWKREREMAATTDPQPAAAIKPAPTRNRPPRP